MLHSNIILLRNECTFSTVRPRKAHVLSVDNPAALQAPTRHSYTFHMGSSERYDTITPFWYLVSSVASSGQFEKMIIGYGVGSGATNVVGVSDGEIVGDPVTGASVGEAEGDLVVGSAVSATGAQVASVGEAEGDLGVGSAVTATGAQEAEDDIVGDAVTGISVVGYVVVVGVSFAVGDADGDDAATGIPAVGDVVVGEAEGLATEAWSSPRSGDGEGAGRRTAVGEAVAPPPDDVDSSRVGPRVGDAVGSFAVDPPPDVATGADAGTIGSGSWSSYPPLDGGRTAKDASAIGGTSSPPPSLPSSSSPPSSPGLATSTITQHASCNGNSWGTFANAFAVAALIRITSAGGRDDDTTTSESSRGTCPPVAMRSLRMAGRANPPPPAIFPLFLGVVGGDDM
ncbi:hypothetical protein ACHAW5_010248 [Stephanodiscus triporus]|uniref:Uncharacterized protein n=1 Tax=Stephanodiscus triporus TaxID=2934178 RepID=A0ABD3PGK1_9STRA